jgi:CHAT domain-containing protein/tetratricopeptide (TPR) repeat protein/Tol biopolymer transport system component
MRLKYIIKTVCCLIYALMLLSAGILPCTAEDGNTQTVHVKKKAPKRLPVNEPEQITAETDPVLHFAVSGDGKWLVFTSARESFPDLWLGSADPSAAVLPRRLTDDPSEEAWPAFSPDRRYIAYTGTAFDAKGDIYLLDIKAFLDSEQETRMPSPIRVTGRDTEDAAPCFSPDGTTLYFHQITHDNAQIVSSDLKSLSNSRESTDNNYKTLIKNAAFPSISPEGTRLAFVSYRNGPDGDIFISDLQSGSVSQMTEGPFTDLFPAWSADGKSLFFSRIAPHEDNAVICNVSPLTPHPSPLTRATSSAFQPRIARSKLFFLSNQGGVSNCRALPTDGEIPALDTVEKQMRLAEEISLKTPADPYLTLLGYHKILEIYSDKAEYAAKAGYKIGKMYQKFEMSEAAASAFEIVRKNYADIQPESSLSLMEETVMRLISQLKQPENHSEQILLIKDGCADMSQIAAEQSSFVKCETDIKCAELLIEYGKDSASLRNALELLNDIIEHYSAEKTSYSESLGFSRLNSEKEQAAEAMMQKADVYSMTGNAEKVYPLYLAVIKSYPNVSYADEAVKRIIKISMTGAEEANLDRQIKLLRKIAEENKEKYPILSAGALNRVGDAYFATDEWDKAKSAYRQVLEQFPNATMTQTAAARLALAEILYREERFRQAIDLYESEIALRPYDDRIYHLARMGYIRKSVAAGEFLYRLGEIPSARKNFKELIDYDETITEAHRGYIKCAAASKEIREVSADYRKKLKSNPSDPIALYNVALCLTYLEDKDSLRQARKLLLETVSRSAQSEYFHQTLGYVLEVLETVHGEKGLLETALESYKKAYFLNDHQNNPDNAANLLLNLGNVYYLLGQYGKAFEYYSLRLDTALPFDNTNTEILFYTRLGAAAFQTKESEKTVSAFTKALDLINARIEPKQASLAFDKIKRYVMDRIVSPALRDNTLAKQAKVIAKSQSEINRKLGKLTQVNVSLPSPEWTVYKKGVEALLSEQEKLNQKIAPLAPQLSPPAAESLSSMIVKVREALDFPERLMQLKAEMLDRLALACQEKEDWDKAAKTFQETFALNEQLGLYHNLPKNKRSVAYNIYMDAGTFTGEKRTELLRKAAEAFSEVIALVKQYGIPEKKQVQGKGLVNIATQISFDESNTTEAAHGFSALQEIRLAEAFLSRIHIELGELKPAESAVKAQLAQYEDKVISDKDAYGVSLLYHRAGHIVYALGKLDEAFDCFRCSAELSLRMKNPVSSAISVTNMAKTKVENAKRNMQSSFSFQLDEIDKKTSNLLAENPFVGGKPVAANYHNKMGVYLMEDLKLTSHNASLQSSVQRVRSLKNAADHFLRGIRLFEERDNRRYDKEELALLSALHLNIASVALDLGENENAAVHFSTALELSERGIFPDLQWRALAGLGRLEEALETSDSVTMLNAGCAAQEITNIFAPLVANLVKGGKAEEAFNLAEKLSETERFNRMAFLFGELPEKEKILYRNLYPKLQQISELRRKTAEAQGEEKQYLQERLTLEIDFVQSKFGKDHEELSDMIRFLPDEETREQVMILLGLAAHAQEAEKLSDFQYLIEQYREVMAAAISRRGEDQTADIFTFFGAEPAEAIDVMEHLPEHGKLIRVFKVKDEELILFTLTRDEIKAVTADSLQQLDIHDEDSIYLAYENPAEIQGHESFALSGTHFVRSVKNRKPFKRALLSIPPLDETLKSYDQIADFRFPIANFHTLLLSQNVSMFTSVPTRAGEYPEMFPAMEMTDNGERFRLEKLLKNAPNLSLALLPGASPDDAYLFGHLFSLYGCPGIVIAQGTMSNSKQVKAFLNSYSETSAVEALKIANRQSAMSNSKWLLLGYHGMTRKEASEFAAKNFESHIVKARNAFADNKAAEALSLFENAILTAKETADFQVYLPNLCRFARESAYKAENTEKAIEYAKLLRDIMTHEKPESEAHAEALLTLGLLYAKVEQYENAVPALEQSVEMLTNLEATEKQAAALADLGIVLENATNYDSALVQFKSAASLSKTSDQKELLAAQYMNIGRIYDLRLSQYALAIQSYTKALSAYRDMRQSADTAQSLLDIGRCFRLLGNFPQADKHYLESFRLAESEKDNLLLMSKIIIEQANNAWYQARYEEAFQLQRKCYRMAKENDFPLMQVISLNTAGLIWWTLGDNRKAYDELKKAMTAAQTLKDRDDEIATTLNNTGMIYRETGQYQEALKAFDDALAIDTRLKSRWAMAYDFRNKALTYLKMGDIESAIPLFEKAVSESHEIGDRVNETKAMLGFGDAFFALGKHNEAKDIYEKTLKLSCEMSLRESEWRALYGLGRAHLVYNDRNTAKKFLSQAVEVVENIRAEIKINQLKDSFVADKLSVYETLVQLIADMGKVTESFEMAERSRARNFIDLLGNQRLSLSRATDQELYNRQQLIKSRIAEHEALLAQSHDDAERNMYRETLRSLRNDLQDVMLEIQAENPQLASLVSVEPIKTDQLLGLLEPGIALLAYYVLPDEIFCWVVQREGIKLFRTHIGRDSLGQAILDFRRMIQNLEPLEEQSEQLFKYLIEPVMPALQYVRILGIIPHGSLHYLSYSVLSDRKHFLIDRFPLFYLPGASVLNYTLSKRVQEKNVNVLAIGNPDLGDAAFDLPFAEYEVDSVKWNFPNITVMTRDKATESWVIRNIGKFGIIYMASHGEFDPVNPLFSAIKLAKDMDADGNLEAAEVFGLKINADMVVLSACQTGLGKVTDGDDVIGLNRAFFYAGAHTIVSTLWRVSDLSTAILIKQFYREYVTQSKAESLRRAILHVKTSYPHPGYWGAFTLVGDYE